MDLYEPSDNTIWTDPYISTQLLRAHLDTTTDAASRRPETIHRTIGWILEPISRPARLVDLGCGPGLYAEEFCRRGHDVAGVDINPASVDHATRSAASHGLPIEYLQADYLTEFSPRTFDLATCIYCDFGALTPGGQSTFLENAFRLLEPGGQLVFDVFGPGICATKTEGRSWSEEPGNGLWAQGPHFLLSECMHFPEAKAWGQKFVLLPEQGAPRRFVLWDHYFTEESIQALVERAGFRVLEIERGLVPRNDFACDDVLFVRAGKPGRR